MGAGPPEGGVRALNRFAYRTEIMFVVCFCAVYIEPADIS